MPTEARYLVEAVKEVPGPKGIALEEGAMADWAMRVMKPYVSEVLVCDPRRNRLISEDGDKTDVVDAGKLAELYRLGSLRAVHHPRRQSMMDLRAWVWAYHDQVGLVTAAKNKIKAAFRAGGVAYSGGEIYGVSKRDKWLSRLERASVRDRVKELYGNLDELAARRDRMHERLQRTARRHPVTKQFLAIPGYGPIRSLTFLVVVDTPYRFGTPQQLWRYSGLGPRREQSGDPNRVRWVAGRQYNRRLKAVARGALEKVLSLGDGNPFATIYERLVDRGVKESLARVSVARKLLSVPWGMWKNGAAYDPGLVTAL
jgi:transposase